MSVPFAFIKVSKNLELHIFIIQPIFFTVLQYEIPYTFQVADKSSTSADFDTYLQFKKKKNYQNLS